ncbi:MAG TPA: glycosyltransferase [Candidatus Acidoferrum sp.]|nr:glycosyltransferase [Candidatus Acidoferrum sp.]
MIGKRIVFCTFGSLGDLHPFLALALEMKRRGHDPLIATSPMYREMIESAGVGFHAVRPKIDVSDPAILKRAMHRRTGMNYIMFELLMPSLRDSYHDTVAAAQGADLIVVHPITLGAYLLCRQLAQQEPGFPWCFTCLSPVSFFSLYDPAVISALPFAGELARLGPGFQSGLKKILAFLLEARWKAFRSLEKELGLTPARNPLIWPPSEAALVLGLFSPQLGAPQHDWPANAHATGFPFYDHTTDCPPAVRRFLDAGEPPIVFTLGSAAVGAAGDFFQQSAQAAQELGKRAILLVGRDPYNQPASLPPEILAVPYAPHAAVFPRGCVNVHQGGIGTTGEAMRAGRPMLVVHYSHDQPDHAARLVRMGLARAVAREKYSAAVAIREIGALLEDQSYVERAAAVGCQVSVENGVEKAGDLLCELS